MKHSSVIRVLTLALCMVMVAALFMAGCGSKEADSASTPVTVKDGDVLGKGSAKFILAITDLEGKTVTAKIKTDKNFVGEALQELGIVAGEMGDYGLYIKTVNGQTLDYEKDGAYWAFYVDNEYAIVSADQTEIVDGTIYSFVAETSEG